MSSGNLTSSLENKEDKVNVRLQMRRITYVKGFTRCLFLMCDRSLHLTGLYLWTALLFLWPEACLDASAYKAVSPPQKHCSTERIVFQRKHHSNIWRRDRKAKVPGLMICSFKCISVLRVEGAQMSSLKDQSNQFGLRCTSQMLHQRLPTRQYLFIRFLNKSTIFSSRAGRCWMMGSPL